MAQLNLDPPLSPRNGVTLKVLSIDRISTRNQDPKSNADQQALVHKWIEDRYDGPVEWVRITGQGSGECIDRGQVRQAEDLVASGQLDVVIMEDLGRHLRRAQAVDFCEQCEDHDTRLVAINDNVDTFKDWRLHAFFAAIKHEQSNKDTSERIKRTLRNRFMQGEVVQFTVFGYIKPPGTKSDDDLQRDPAAEPIYDEWFRMLENGATYSDVADWLNRLQIPTGSYCRSDKWDCKMVGRITHNPILKGLRERNNRKSKRINKSGKRITVKAPPSEKLERNCPHLAFIEPVRYDRLIRRLKQQNGVYKPGGADGPDPRVGRPKKRTIFPGQHIFCGICGRLYRYGGHGQTDHLLCRGAYEYRCWNAITVDGPLASKKLSAAILGEIEGLPDFDSVFREICREQFDQANSSRSERLDVIRRKETELRREMANLVAFVREGRRTQSLHEELDRVEAELDGQAMQREAIEQEPVDADILPSIEEIKQLVRVAMVNQADEPYEFGRLMHELIPQIVVYPYRLCDGGAIVLRAKFTLSLASLLPPAQRLENVDEVLRRVLVVDLFDPPQREAYRLRVMALKVQGLKERQIAMQLGITQTAVQRAAALQRLMNDAGLIDPYVPVLEPPDDFKKLRRHKHPRYKFEPLPDADV